MSMRRDSGGQFSVGGCKGQGHHCSIAKERNRWRQHNAPVWHCTGCRLKKQKSYQNAVFPPFSHHVCSNDGVLSVKDAPV